MKGKIVMKNVSLLFRGRLITDASLKEWAEDNFGELPVIHRYGLTDWDNLHSVLLTAVSVVLTADTRTPIVFDVLVGRYYCKEGMEICTLRLAPKVYENFTFELGSEADVLVKKIVMDNLNNQKLSIELKGSIRLEIFLHPPEVDALTEPMIPPDGWFEEVKA